MAIAVKTSKLIKVFFKKTLKIWVLKNIDLEINCQSFTVIFGPSGSGKSTLLNTIIGLQRSTSGSIKLLDTEISEFSQDDLALLRKYNIGIMSQKSEWVNALNVIENVAIPLYLQGIPRDEALLKAQTLLGEVGMLRWKEYNPNELSSGQQQKVSFARALVNNPKILIADEPTGNLDSTSTDAIITLFRKFVDSGGTLLVISHDREIANAADTLVQIVDGHVIEVFELKNLKKEKLWEKVDKNYEEYKEESKINKDELNENIEEFKINNLSRFSGIIDFFKLILKYLFFIPLMIVFSFSIIFDVMSFRFFHKYISDLTSKFALWYDRISEKVYSEYKDSMKISEKINIVLKNLYYKKSRSFFTVGGVAIGISFIVLLLSLGFGIEKLVVDRVAGLNGRFQTDAIPSIASNINITDKTVSDFESLDQVSDVFPVYRIPTSVNFKGFSSDVVAYSVEEEYIKNLDSKITSGETFGNSDYKIILNQATIDRLSEEGSNLIGQKILLTFTFDELNDNNESIQSESSIQFEIIGTIEGDENLEVFVPLEIGKSLGIQSYSEMRVQVKNQADLLQIRQNLEAIGLQTESVSDVIFQIESFFASVRSIFIVIGSVALMISFIGMFNTLTVSLFERTREIGLLKAIGIKSNEARELFLLEGTMMGILGGTTGIILGILFGKIVSLVFSLLSIANGDGFIDVAYFPLSLSIAILVVTLFISLLTGYFPSSRATKIEPMDALRYE